MSPLEVSVVLFGTFGLLVLLRVPVAFALGLACLPVFIADQRLSPMLAVNEMWKSYNAFILLAVPFFLLDLIGYSVFMSILMYFHYAQASYSDFAITIAAGTSTWFLLLGIWIYARRMADGRILK